MPTTPKSYLDDNGLLYFWNKLKTIFYRKPATGIPKSDLADSVQGSLDLADSAIQTETDPTVPSWAKASTKPTYTAQEVGALPSSTVIPSALADLSADSTHRTVTDTEKTAWNAKPTTADVNALISAAMKGGYELVASLPTASAETQGKIYLVPSSGSGTNTKDEYITVQESGSYRWEKIGSTDVDLSGYLKTTDITEISNSEIDTIVAS